MGALSREPALVVLLLVAVACSAALGPTREELAYRALMRRINVRAGAVTPWVWIERFLTLGRAAGWAAFALSLMLNVIRFVKTM